MTAREKIASGGGTQGVPAIRSATAGQGMSRNDDYGDGSIRENFFNSLI